MAMLSNADEVLILLPSYFVLGRPCPPALRIDMTAAQTLVSAVQLGGISWTPSNPVIFAVFVALMILHGFINMMPIEYLRVSFPDPLPSIHCGLD